MLIKAFSRFDQSSDVRKNNWRRRKSIANYLKSLIKSTDLGEKIDLCGAADRIEVKEMMQKSHCLVISSHIETFGEAMRQCLVESLWFLLDVEVLKKL